MDLENQRERICALPADQQPSWSSDPALPAIRRTLDRSPALVPVGELGEARRQIAEVADGNAFVLQVGDCAESFFDSGPRATRARLTLIDQLASHMEAGVGCRPVVRFARMAGQFAKPRSTHLEPTPSGPLPVFRGHLVNSEVPALSARRHDPRRMLRGYAASARVAAEVRRVVGIAEPGAMAHEAPVVWLTHEALVLDYELAMLRQASVAPYLASAHLPWVGERTRRLDGAHVELLACIRNPVMCKIGAGAGEAEVEALVRRLNPHGIGGRLTLACRFGARDVVRRLPSIVAAVRRTGIPVVWVCDPMHGNTLRFRDGRKTRRVADMRAEVAGFVAVLGRFGIQAGGLHMEVAPDDAGECIGDEPVMQMRRPPGRVPALCDPRMSPQQARVVIDEFTASQMRVHPDARRAASTAAA